MRSKVSVGAVLCGLGLVVFGAACGGGDDTGGDTGGAAGNGGSAAGTGGAGTAGGGAGSGGSAAGSGGSAGAGAGGSAGTAEPVVCGGTTCPTPSSTRLRACCVAGTDTCGEQVAGGFIGRCAEPVEPHPECESAMSMSFTIPSCCTEEGRCGITAPMIGLPCTSNDDIMAMYAGDGGMGDGGMPRNPLAITPPPAKDCTP